MKAAQTQTNTHCERRTTQSPKLQMHFEAAPAAATNVVANELATEAR